jgi:probable rRNA maturation factor
MLTDVDDAFPCRFPPQQALPGGVRRCSVIVQAPVRRWHQAWPDYRKTMSAAAKQTVSLAIAPNKQRCTLTIRLSDDAEIYTLNQQFRGQAKATNVLSFPNDTPTYGGDVILAYETVAREAHEQRKPFSHHATHLVVHGVLHLLQYNHETDAEAAIMEALEQQILQRFAIPNPYSDLFVDTHD